MWIAPNVAGFPCVLMGCVWFLQGIDVLPGSFMSGQSKWAVSRAVLPVVGIVLLVAGRRVRA